MDPQPQFQNKRHRPPILTTPIRTRRGMTTGLLPAEIIRFPNDVEALAIYGLTMERRADN